MTAAHVALQAVSNFSFLEGASHPEELVETAAALGHAAIAVTDRNSLAGVVRAHVAAKAAGIPLVIGARIDLQDAPSVLVYPTDRAAYGRLCRLITLGRRRAPKGECHLAHADLLAHGEGQVAVLLPPARRADLEDDSAFARALAVHAAEFRGRAYLALPHLYRADDGRRLARLAELARRFRLPAVAAGAVVAHDARRRPLADVLTCIRTHTTVESAGYRLAANAERHLKPPAEMARLYRAHPAALDATAEIAARCRFSLDELRYEYPDADLTPAGRDAEAHLADLTEAGARARYPAGVPAKVRAQIAHELALIRRLRYAPYFLTVHDIVRFARARGILCQGRGSAANSAVCYCLGITAVDPERSDLLFERFISVERGEPPDIDVDFEHERREEVIQYLYGKYGRDRAGLTATVISYRSRSAIREVGKALGLSLDLVARLADAFAGRGRGTMVTAADLAALGLDARDPTLARALDLAGELRGFPRHLSQHVGGFVVTRGPLSELVPIENAAMAERTVIQWDKDDIDALGILKVDVLGLGMLSCLRRGFDLLERHRGIRLDPATVPAEDPAVYDMLCRADSLGVFQVESRAQMSMLPRLKPRCFYDLVIEVAIVRPGPIQGDMVHPYLRRRAGEEAVDYPSPALEAVLGKTLGVPLFQEQAMKIAVVAAGFTPGEADQLRRAMATFRRTGTIQTFRQRMVAGMVANGYAAEFAERCFHQIEGFGEYGFPESHAASFALLVYLSAWLKYRHPAVFACALLNSQPMGFYAPAQIVRDAREHGVEVRAVDVNASDWDCTLEPAAGDALALRLGLRQVKGLAEAPARALVAARGAGYPDVDALARRSGLPLPVLLRLARADAFRSLGLDRRAAEWAVAALDAAPPPLLAAAGAPVETGVTLPLMPLSEHVVRDYRSLRLSLKAHPVSFLRAELARRGVTPADRLPTAANGRRITVAGLVLVRQRPATAKGVIFATLEDETGVANVIFWPDVFERFRRAAVGASLLAVSGRLQREGRVIHVIAARLVDLSPRLAALRETAGQDLEAHAPTDARALEARSRDFH